MPTNCAVKGCKNTSVNCKLQNSSVRFYSFPHRTWEADRRKAWTKFCQRDVNSAGTEWEPTAASRICSTHFIGGVKDNKELSASYNPTIHPLRAISKKTCENLGDRSKRYYKRLQRTSLKEITNSNSSGVFVNSSPGFKRVQIAKVLLKAIPKSSQTEVTFSRGVLLSFESTFDCNSVMCQVIHTDVEKESGSASCVLMKQATFNGYKSMRNPQILMSFTGVTEPVFEIFVHLLSNSSPRHYWNQLCVRDRVLLVLTKLRHNLPFVVLGPLFNVCQQSAAKEFNNTVNLLTQLTKDWIRWIPQSVVRATTPDCFRPAYSNVRVIIDCSEIRCETPDKVDLQNHFYSNYKSSHTVKFLIGVSPAGLITFLSDAYGGRSTDTEITKNCGLLNLLEPGDIVLADKGFPNIQLVNNAVLVMPPFSCRNQVQFTVSQMEATYSIARVRIHVERVIGRMKKFRILQDKLPSDLIVKIDKILHLCAVIVNLSKPIVPNKTVSD